MRCTKIICTIGPTSKDDDSLRALIRAGMDVARLNFSHGTIQEHTHVLQRIRVLSKEEGKVVSVLQDLCGPKLRIGAFVKGSVMLHRGQKFILTPRQREGDETGVSVGIQGLPELVGPGNEILLADGDILLKVDKVDGDLVLCEVLSGGEIQSKRGIALPGVSLPLESITEKDLQDLQKGVELGMDWIAASFVRDAADLKRARGILHKLGSDIPLIAKIEKREALENLDEILEEADGVMVARGDLGVEIPIEDVPDTQKEIIREANERGKPVIVATQMLESMVHNPRPTRAEATDVANAILDGADALMLSAETAVGDSPARVVTVMDRIARAAEKRLREKEDRSPSTLLPGEDLPSAISHGCRTIADETHAAAILCCTHSGYTARMVAKRRPFRPLIGITSQEITLRRMPLYWGVTPLLIQSTEGTDKMIHRAEDAAIAAGLVREGDLVVLTAGLPLTTPGTTNMILAHRIGDAL